MNRREAVQRGLQLLAGTALGGCMDLSADPNTETDPLLVARPGTPTVPGETGLDWIGGSPGEGGMYFVPSTATQDQPMPLVMFLHGAGRRVETLMNAFAPVAESAGVMIVAPLSIAGTWDAIIAKFGQDIVDLDAVLRYAFDRWTIDPQRIQLWGFSDGATYALAVGRRNGNLFSKLVAFSPGFLIDITPLGRPPILITHATDDPILPYENTANGIVPALRGQGFDVDFRTFTGGHAVPLSVVNEVLANLHG